MVEPLITKGCGGRLTGDLNSFLYFEIEQRNHRPSKRDANYTWFNVQPSAQPTNHHTCLLFPHTLAKPAKTLIPLLLLACAEVLHQYAALLHILWHCRDLMAS
jgi:hypothetical protein